MMNQSIEDVLNAFIILLKGDEKVIGEIELLSINTVKLWCSSKIEELPLEVRSAISHELESRSEILDFLDSVVQNKTLTQNTYRCVTSMIFETQFKNAPINEFSDDLVRLFVFLLNLSEKLEPSQFHLDHEILHQKLASGNVDHDILHCNYSSELVDHFEDDFEVMSYEGARIKSILGNLYNILKMYQEFNIYNWRYFHLTNQLVDERFIHIRRINSQDGRVKYKNPTHLFD